jgi:hypothetical protein
MKTPNLQWAITDSSQIEAFAFYEPHMKLFIKFRNGSIYEYMNVPKDDYESLQRAESHGKFFHQYIKNNFQHNRIK